MKTLEALYQEILASEDLQKEFRQAMNENRVEEALKANGCEAGKEELTAFLKEKQEKQGELADEELDDVAGGGICGSSSAPDPAVTEGWCPMCQEYTKIRRNLNYRYNTATCKCLSCNQGWIDMLTPEERRDIPQDF